MDIRLQEIILSLSTILLAVLAIAIYIYLGGGAIFYIVAVFTALIGFITLRTISKDDAEYASAAHERAKAAARQTSDKNAQSPKRGRKVRKDAK